VLRILRWACWQLRLILTLLTARTRADFSLRLLPVHISLPPREPLPLNLSLILHSGIHSSNRRNPPPRAIYSRRSPGDSINKGHLPSAPSARSHFGQLSRLAAAALAPPGRHPCPLTALLLRPAGRARGSSPCRARPGPNLPHTRHFLVFCRLSIFMKSSRTRVPSTRRPAGIPRSCCQQGEGAEANAADSRRGRFHAACA